MGRRKLIVAGGGTAGSLAARLLESDFDVTLIDSKEYHEVRWASSRAMVEPSVADRSIIPHLEYLRGGSRIVVGVIKSTTEREVIMEDGSIHSFDILIIATGSKPSMAIPFQDKVWGYHKELQKIQRTGSFLVVGGGPTGVEFAAEIISQFPDKKVTLVHSGGRLLECLKPKAGELAEKWLTKRGVTVVLNDRVKLDLATQTSGEGGKFKTARGLEVVTDYLFIAIGSRPSNSWLKATFEEQLDENGRLKVDEYLRVESFNNIYALGDITNVKEFKQGTYAQDQAKRCVANLKAMLQEGPNSQLIKPYIPGPDVGIVCLGKHNGVAQLPMPVGIISGWLPAMMRSKGLFIERTRKELGLTF